MIMTWIAYIDGRDGERISVIPQEQIMPVTEQAKAALAAIPEGTLKKYIAPLEEDLAAMAFPLAGITILVVMILDQLLISRIPALKWAFS